MITDAQIISAIIALIIKNGYAPSFREIGQHVGFKSPSTIHVRMRKLRKLGLVDWEPKQPRTLRLLINV